MSKVSSSLSRLHLQGQVSSPPSSSLSLSLSLVKKTNVRGLKELGPGVWEFKGMYKKLSPPCTSGLTLSFLLNVKRKVWCCKDQAENWWYFLILKTFIMLLFVDRAWKKGHPFLKEAMKQSTPICICLAVCSSEQHCLHGKVWHWTLRLSVKICLRSIPILSLVSFTQWLLATMTALTTACTVYGIMTSEC